MRWQVGVEGGRRARNNLGEFRGAEQKVPVQILAPPLPNYVTLGQLFNLLKPQSTNV